MNTIQTRSKAPNNCDSQISVRNKRNLSPEISKTENTNAKKVRPSKMTSKDIEELKSLITSTAIGIENRISNSHQILESKFNELGNKVNNDVQLLRCSVDEFKSQVGSEMNVIKVQLNEHKQRFENNDDDFERMKRNQDLRITGIIYKDNENLIEICKKIAVEIGFNIEQCSSMPTLERIPIRNKTTGQMIPSNTTV